MMNYTEILKGAWRNVLSYRALWVFGIVLALVTSSWGTAALIGRDDEGELPIGLQVERRSYETWAEAFQRTFRRELRQAEDQLESLLADELGFDVESDLATWLTVFLSVVVVLYLLGRVARYVCDTALIRMVNSHQATGEQQTVRGGLRLGWSRSAWRLYFIELTINLVTIAASLFLLALVFSPLPLWIQGSESTVIAGAVLTAAVFFLAIFVVILVAAFVSLVKLFSRRACAIENLGVTASIYRGYTLVRRNLKRIISLGIVMLAVNAIWPAVIGIALLVLLSLGILVGGLPALAVNWLAGAAAAGNGLLTAAIVVGVVLLLLLLAAPLAWLGGMRQVFLSSMWTLAYSELCEMDRLAQVTPPRHQDEPGLATAPPAL